MNPALTLDAISGHPLSGEQKLYLDGFFAGIANRGFSFEDVLPNPAVSTARNAAEPPTDLIFEERAKRELHPLDAYPLLLEHSVSNKAPERENIFRFKWHGLFYLTPNKEAFMARLRARVGRRVGACGSGGCRVLGRAS